jgi:hypothetical protein
MAAELEPITFNKAFLSDDLASPGKISFISYVPFGTGTACRHVPFGALGHKTCNGT